MLTIRTRFEFNLQDILGGLNNRSIAQLTGSIARRERSEILRIELNAPGPGPPARNPFEKRLRRVTGQLADTSFIRPSKGGLRQAIVFPASYAAAAHAKKPWTEHYMERRGEVVVRDMDAGIRRLLKR